MQYKNRWGLTGSKSSGWSSKQHGDRLPCATAELVEEYFSSTGVGAPEMEGYIWLKSENKKSWKKFHFILRTSGLYYSPKGKKTSKDLLCLCTFDVNQVYYGVGWKRKFKSPTDFCFGIKHPQIQARVGHGILRKVLRFIRDWKVILLFLWGQTTPK